ncbi:hypothetical protein [Actinocorallia aurea]
MTFELTPYVMGPDNTPKITDLDEACADVSFTAVSAVVNALDPDAGGILETLMEALDSVDIESATSIAEFAEAGFQTTPAALDLWKALMSTSTKRFVSHLRSESEARGEARGEAKALLLFLQGRGIAVSDAARARITGCTDAEQLEAWILRVPAVTTVEELFA